MNYKLYKYPMTLLLVGIMFLSVNISLAVLDPDAPPIVTDPPVVTDDEDDKGESVCVVRKKKLLNVKELSDISFEESNIANKKIIIRLKKIKVYWRSQGKVFDKLDKYIINLEKEVGEFEVLYRDYNKKLDLLYVKNCDDKNPKYIAVDLDEVKKKRLEVINKHSKIKKYLSEEVVVYVDDNNKNSSNKKNK